MQPFHYLGTVEGNLDTGDGASFSLGCDLTRRTQGGSRNVHINRLAPRAEMHSGGKVLLLHVMVRLETKMLKDDIAQKDTLCTSRSHFSLPFLHIYLRDFVSWMGVQRVLSLDGSAEMVFFL